MDTSGSFAKKKDKCAKEVVDAARDGTDQSFADLCVNLSKNETKNGTLKYYDASNQPEKPRLSRAKKSSATRTRSKGENGDTRRWDGYGQPNANPRNNTGTQRPASSISPP